MSLEGGDDDTDMKPRLLEGVKRQAIGLRIRKKVRGVCCSLSSLTRNFKRAMIASSFHTIYKSTSAQEMRIYISCGQREGVIMRLVGRVCVENQCEDL